MRPESIVLLTWACSIPVVVFLVASTRRVWSKWFGDDVDGFVVVIAGVFWPLSLAALALYGTWRAGVWLGSKREPAPPPKPRPAFYADDRPNVRIVLPATGSYRTRMIVTAKGLAFNGQELVDDLKTKITVEEVR